MADALVAWYDEHGADEPVRAAPYLRQRWRDASYTPTTDAAGHTLPDLALLTGYAPACSSPAAS